MRKKNLAAAALAAAVAAGIFTGCGGRGDIGREAALEAALSDAGVNEADTTRLRVSEDRDDGRKVYEIQFDVAEREYDYEIQASDGAILSSETEINENYTTVQGNTAQDDNTSQDVPDQNTADTDQNGTTAGQSGTNTGQNGKNQSGGQAGNRNNAGGSASGPALSQEEAVQIALDRVEGATAQDVRIELERDDGRCKYEGEIIYNFTEYDFEIDANTGTILEWSEERF